MTPATRDTAIRALRASLDTMLNDIRINSDWYVKGDWRGDLHRKSAAVEIRAIRQALRELTVRAYPAWYATEPLAAYQRESR